MNHIRRVLFLLALSSGFSLAAQNSLKHLEIGFTLGTLNYSGDVATTNNPSALLNEMGPRFGVHLKRYTRPWFNYNFEGSYGWFSAKDVNHTNVSRGYVLKTHLVQTNASMEFNLAKFGKYYQKNKVSPFIKLGAGMLFYSPKLENFESFPPQYDLYPNAYVGFHAFGGLGCKFRVGYSSVLTVEATFHNSFTDHLEGFETNDGSSQSNDYFGGFAVGYSWAIY